VLKSNYLDVKPEEPKQGYLNQIAGLVESMLYVDLLYYNDYDNSF
jgi:hypothetical protein